MRVGTGGLLLNVRGSENVRELRVNDVLLEFEFWLTLDLAFRVETGFLRACSVQDLSQHWILLS